jgi:hypothetical protein
MSYTFLLPTLLSIALGIGLAAIPHLRKSFKIWIGIILLLALAAILAVHLTNPLENMPEGIKILLYAENLTGTALYAIFALPKFATSKVRLLIKISLTAILAATLTLVIHESKKLLNNDPTMPLPQKVEDAFKPIVEKILRENLQIKIINLPGQKPITAADYTKSKIQNQAAALLENLLIKLIENKQMGPYYVAQFSADPTADSVKASITNFSENTGANTLTSTGILKATITIIPCYFKDGKPTCDNPPAITYSCSFKVIFLPTQDEKILNPIILEMGKPRNPQTYLGN